MKVSCLWSASLACLLFATPWITPWASPMEKNENLTLFTEEFPPFNFTEAGKTTGVSTEVVEAVLKQAGYDYEIRSYPWARTYKVAQETPNALVFLSVVGLIEKIYSSGSAKSFQPYTRSSH